MREIDGFWQRLDTREGVCGCAGAATGSQTCVFVS